jgi:hypothetical protein
LTGLLPLRNGLHAFQVSRCVSFERFRVDYKNRLTFPKYSNDSAVSNTNCCHSLDIAPIRFLFPSMFSAITADNGDYIGFAVVNFAMYYHTANLRIPIFG